MKKKWKIIFGAILSVALIAVIFLFLFEGEEVEVIEVKAGDISRSFTEDGVIESPDERKIHSMVNSKIEELKVSKGERVEKGDLIAVLDDSELDYRIRELQANLMRIEGESRKLEQEPGEAELERMELNIELAEDDKASAKDNYQRTKKLYEEGFVSEQAYEEAEKFVNEARYNVDLQKKSVEVLRESYEPPPGSEQIISAQRNAINSQIEFLKHQKKNYYQIKAPRGGVVTDLTAKEGEVINPQTPLLRIFHPGDYQLKVEVLTKDTYDIYEGMEVNLTLAKNEGDRKFTGEIKEIAPYAREDVSPLGLEEERVEVTIIPDTPEDLYIAPGYKLDVEFVTEKKLDQLVVPNTAVFDYEGVKAVFVVDDDRAKIKEVSTGLDTREDIVITSGINIGDLVIINPEREGIVEDDRISGVIKRSLK